MGTQYIRTANLMRSTPTLSNGSLKKTNSELVHALAHTLTTPSDVMNPITDERAEYEITTKLFFLPTSSQVLERVSHIQAAVAQVQASLHIDTLDLLILSFPSIVLDAEDAGTFDENDLHEILEVYNAAVKQLVETGKVKSLGVAEFSAVRLQQLCDNVTILPTVNQINLKDCCVTPRDLILFAKKHQIKLFTHGDSSNILSADTLRTLYQQHGKEATHDVPIWVCKYTAVASSRGVVENKGYIVALQ